MCGVKCAAPVPGHIISCVHSITPDTPPYNSPQPMSPPCHVGKDAVQEEAYTLALDANGVSKWLHGKEVVKVIYVAGRIINIIAK